MKIVSALSFLILINGSVLGQNEFPVYENNLIYDAATMERLSDIVDSLNVKFSTCDLPHPYYSLPQGTATYYFFDKNISDVEMAMAKNMSREELVKKFPPAEVRKGVSVVRTEHSYRDNKEVVYLGFPQSDDDGILDVDLPYAKDNIKVKGWISHRNSVYLWAFYLDGLEVKEIPHDYARLIQYVDCMIDTTSRIFLSPAAKAPSQMKMDEDSKAGRFIRWANDYPGKPVLEELDFPEEPTEEDFRLQRERYERYNRDYFTWDSLRLADLDLRMKNSHWRSVLREITNDAVRYGVADEELEFYIERYVSPEVALYLKRTRKVFGTCSMDRSPRIHAMNICRLAARTGKWNIFLRSQLDIMNDRFERTSDGSWAFEGRQTYLKELEALDIHVTDLLLGTVLRTSSVSDNHYFGDVGRMGRALAETSTADAVETQLLAMIKDSRLDLLNRVLSASLFQAYNYYLRNGHVKERNRARMMEALMSLPDDLRDGIGVSE